MSFKSEAHYLVHLVKCGINETTPQPLPQGFSLERIFYFGKEHEVANIAFLAVEKLENIEEKLLNKWKAYYYSCIKRDIEQTNLLRQVLYALSSNDIRTLQVQGTVVKNYYPSSDLRTMTDIDLIVEKQNLKKASQVLLDLGFKVESENQEEWSGYNSQGLLVELHTDFFYSVRTFQNGIKCSTGLSGAFNYVVDGSQVECYTNETVLYLYNLLHCLKHYLSGGAGIRRILDLYILKQKLQNRVDNEYIGRVLERCKIKSIATRLIMLADYWFGEVEPNIDLSGGEEMVFASKNHGDTKVLVKRKLARDKAQGKKFLKLRYFFGRIFISKELCYYYYPFCKKHKYPLFLCWLHRLVVLPFSKKRKSVIKEVKNLINTKQKDK